MQEKEWSCTDNVPENHYLILLTDSVFLIACEVNLVKRWSCLNALKL